jgi:hypothetical protein
MKKIQVYLSEAELEALRQAAASTGRSVSALIREATRQVLKPATEGPVALWDGQPRGLAAQHEDVDAFGLWEASAVDGLEYERRLRSEW